MTIGRIPSVEGGIQPTIVDAKGDILTATAADTPAVLAVGNNGETLVADSSATTGLRWAADWNAGKNAVINGDFNIWQRGTSFSAPTAAYTADRFAALTSGTASRSTDAPTGFTYSLQLTHTSPSFNIAYHRIEAARTNALTPTVTLSFWAKKTAGTDDLQVAFYHGNPVDNFTSPTFIGQFNITNGNFSTSWVRYSLTTTLTSTALANGLEFRIFTANGSTNGFRLTGVQLESGSVATPFTTATGTLAGELAACQRYYYRSGGSSSYEVFGWGIAASTTALYIQTKAPVTMRIAPTAVDYSTLTFVDQVGGSFPLTAVGINQGGKDITQIYCTVASGLTQYRSYYLTANNSTSAYFGLSAEL